MTKELENEMNDVIEKCKNNLCVIKNRKVQMSEKTFDVEVHMDIVFNLENCIELGAFVSRETLASILGKKILLEIDEKTFSKMK